MKVAGIVCEFNPFHTGHERLLSYCRNELGADAIVCCMSGNFVQRGEPAIMDKYTRALTAIRQDGQSSAAFKRGEALAPARAGADLVIELPVIGATANAETFARTGVNTLLGTGIVTDLVFGSESGDEGAIESAAGLLTEEPPAFKAALSRGLKKGLSYPAAMAEAAAVCGADSLLFKNPNDLLGILYVKALLENEKAAGRSLSFHAVKREGAGHDRAAAENSSYTSSSAIRRTLQAYTADGQNSSIGQGQKSPMEKTAFEMQRPFLPPASYEVLSTAAAENALVFPDDLSLLLHEKLYSCAGRDEGMAFPSSCPAEPALDLTAFSDIDGDLKNRILKKREVFTSFTAFAEILDTRNYTRARCMRALLHLVIGITGKSVAALKACNYSPYIHVLAMNDAGAGLLSKMKKVCEEKSEKALGKSSHLSARCSVMAFSAKPPVFCALSEPAAKSLSPDAAAVLQKDLFANDIYNIILTQKNGKPRVRETSRKVLKI